MRRRNGAASTGCIQWPVHLANTREGGMWVYAVVVEESRSTKHKFRWDPFVQCVIDNPTLPYPDAFLDPHPPSLRATKDAVLSGRQQPVGRLTAYLWPRKGDSAVEILVASRLLLACVLLGTSGGSWFDEQKGQNWICQESDLTREGKMIVRSLSRLYQREVRLLTFLDT